MQIKNLDLTTPNGSSDLVSEGAGLIREIKATLKYTFPNMDSAVNMSSSLINNFYGKVKFSGTSFNFNGLTVDNITSDLDSVPSREYSDTRYIKLDEEVPTLSLNYLTKIDAKQSNAVLRSLIRTDSNGLVLGDKNSNIQINASSIELDSSDVEFMGGSSILDMIYPVGSVYENGTNSTNPGTLLGFGTWQPFGSGRVLVSANTLDTVDVNGISFRDLGVQGGEKRVTMIEDNLPPHVHRFPTGHAALLGAQNPALHPGLPNDDYINKTANTGSGESHNNIQPYIVVYRWVRTA